MLILASASKARKSLLERAGIPHDVIVSDINENDIDEKDVKKLVLNLSIAKSKSVVSKILEFNIKNKKFEGVSAVIGCDSLFEFEGEIFGKPSNKREAFDRLHRMSLSFGYIHTGHSLLFKIPSFRKNDDIYFDGMIKEVITTKIKFNQINPKDILSYIETGEPMKCAGGFALEGRGSIYIKEIEGCFSNVIGLSLPWLFNNIKKLNLDYF